jgi:hypothetical protein
MKRNLKVLGIALAAVFAMSAVAASGASAHYIFTPGASPAWITGTQIAHTAGNKLEIGENVARVECNNAHFKGTSEGTEPSQVTVTAEYEECTTHASGINAASTVDMNGCAYILTGETTDGTHGIVHIECPGTNVIEVTTPSVNCTVKVKAQTPTSGGISYENTFPTGEKDDVDATATVEGITFERSGGIICAASGIPSEGNNAKLLEKITIRAYKDTGPTNPEGEQVNLTVS